MENLFKKDNLKNLYSKFLSDSLKKIDNDKIPENYKELVRNYHLRYRIQT